MGSGSNPVKNLTISTTFEGKFNKIVLNMATGSSATATVTVKVGGVVVGTENLAATNALYTFNFNTAENAKVEIILTQTTSKALYWKSVEVTCTEACAHTNSSNVPAVEGDCKTEGFTSGVYCNDCDSYISGHESTGFGDHSMNYEITVPETCATEGTEVGTCEVCGEESTRTRPVSNTHTAGIWAYDEDLHWLTCACGEEEDAESLGEHEDGNSDSLCDVCGYELPNEDAAYLEEILDMLEVPTTVTENFSLDGFDGMVTWSVKSGTAITLSGEGNCNATVIRPTDNDAAVVLTATITDGALSRSKDFTVTVTKKAAVVADPITVTASVADLITANGWTTSTTKQTFKLDNNITIKIDGGDNSGKAYNGDHLRIYATDNPAGSMTISVPEGYELVSITITCKSGTYAFLCVGNGSADISNTATAVSGQSVVLNSVKNGTNGKQVQITGIEVTYRPVA